jgi:hypothetical protein
LTPRPLGERITDVSRARTGPRLRRREEDPPTAVQAILRQLHADRRSRAAQRKRVADAVDRGLLLPAELDALREAGWLDA